MDQRCLADIQTEATRIHVLLQRRQHVLHIKDEGVQQQWRMPPDHLNGCAQTLPGEAGAQDVVACDDRFQRDDEDIHMRARVECQHGAVEVGIVFGAG